MSNNYTPAVDAQLNALVTMANFFEHSNSREQNFKSLVDGLFEKWPDYYPYHIDDMLEWIKSRNLPEWALKVFNSTVEEHRIK